jgi:methionyl-tRNA formyltransferase
MIQKVAFFASPDFALPVLTALSQRFEIVLVVTQPDKPAGRGNTLTACAVAKRARALGLPLEQPAKLRGNLEFAQILRDSGADVAITAAYGKILPKSLLGIPKYGFINTHASLLPLYRGAAPIQHALLEGQTITGMTLMQTDVGMDTGDILLQETLEIQPDWTSLELFEALSQQAARMIVPALERIETLPHTPQDHSQATHAPMLEREDGSIRWTDSSNAIYNRYRATFGWPGSYTFAAGKRLKVVKLHPRVDFGKDFESTGNPGEILDLTETGVLVATAHGAIELLELHPENKAKMTALEWFKNFQIRVGMVLG